MIAEQTSGAAAIATIALASTSALGSLHMPGPPAGPTATQSRSALVTAAGRPRTPAPPDGLLRPGDPNDPLNLEYGGAGSASQGGAPAAGRTAPKRGTPVGAVGEHGP